LVTYVWDRRINLVESSMMTFWESRRVNFRGGIVPLCPILLMGRGWPEGPERNRPEAGEEDGEEDRQEDGEEPAGGRGRRIEFVVQRGSLEDGSRWSNEVH
jgi:hypothetical protein